MAGGLTGTACRAVLAFTVLATMALAPLPALGSDMPPEVVQARARMTTAADALAGAEARVEAAQTLIADLRSLHDATVTELGEARAVLDQAVAARLEAQARLAHAEDLRAVAEADNTRALRIHLGAVDAKERRAAELRELAVEAWKQGGETARVVGVVDALASSQELGAFLGAVERLGFGTERTSSRLAAATDVVDVRGRERDDAAALLEVRRGVAARAGELVVERLAAEAAQLEVTAEIQGRIDELDRKLADAAVEREEALLARGAAQHEIAAAAAAALSIRNLAGAPGPGQLSWPTTGRMTSGFGSRVHPIHEDIRHHAGIDIPGPTGQPVLSSAGGRVIAAGERGGYGLAVVVEHGRGLRTLYAHLSAISVQTGQWVGEADRVGLLGSTGQSTGPHLHFEVHAGGVPQDPMRWF
jgi:murein DD-endopeptidase MepM/ murein hydrolase activator NlpD